MTTNLAIDSPAKIRPIGKPFRRFIAKGLGLFPSHPKLLGLALVLLAAALPGRAQDDPRCHDRSATGQIDCHIVRPIVSRPEWVYQDIQFAPGDVVYVNADGCVQTGGWGDTWKRYVNPGGDGSDHLYHGLVRIPTATLAGTDVGNTLTRIKNVVGRPLQVTGEGVPVSQLVLHLGYEDDDYSDNGYDGHDNGTENQCQSENGNDGGPAHLTITICRHEGQCRPPKSRFDFDVVSNWMDINGFLYNPHWSWQDKAANLGKDPHFPNTSDCHEFAQRLFGHPWRSPNFPDCTDQAGLDNVDAPDTFSSNNPVCTGYAMTGASFSGHINWFPVTIEGHAFPIPERMFTDDDDYDFSVRSCGDGGEDPTGAFSGATCNDAQLSLYTNGRKFLHTEFDSDETVDHFGHKEWQDLKDAVDSNNRDFIHQHFEGHTIATGMFGLDGEHDLKSELHPLYALATRQDNLAHDPNEETWLMFVRNRGDEGYCSSQIWYGGFETYTFRLPWKSGMTSVDVDWDKTEFDATEGTATKPVVRAVAPITLEPNVAMARRSQPHVGGDLTSPGGFDAPEIGVYVTFQLGPGILPGAGTTLGPDASTPFIDGVLHLKWTGPSGDGGQPTAGGLSRPGNAGLLSAERAGSRISPPTRDPDQTEEKLEAAIEHLSPQQREKVEKARAIDNRRPLSHRLQRGGPVEKLAASPLTGVRATAIRTHAPVAGPIGRANRKLARDAAQMRALCAASNNAPYGLPPEVCKADTRDHRTNPVHDHRTTPVRDHRTDH
jgi:hypothetical protein